MLILSIMIFSFGVLMLIGSSYSLINGVVSKESYSFNVANFDVQFHDNTKISLSGIPTSDEDGLKNSREFSFTINNNSNRDVNYRLDIIESSAFEMKSVVKYAFSLNDSEYSDIYLLQDNFTLNQDKVLKSNEKDTYKLRIWLSLDADEIYMNKVFSASIALQATSNDYKYAGSVISYLGNNNMDGVVKVDNSYRYKGINALNYIWFNCKDNYTKGEDYCEKWRIIGSFNNIWEKGIKEYSSRKIINLNPQELISFDNEVISKNYEESYINKYANGAYYDLLNKSAKDFILNSRWFIGNVSGNDYNSAQKSEKSNYTFANVGLINTSDYLYLGLNDWLKIEDDIMTINKVNLEEINAIKKGVISHVKSDESLSFLPVVNLKPDVSIVNGDGSYDNPYEIEIIYPLSYGIKK